MHAHGGRLATLLTLALGLGGCPDTGRNPFGSISEEVVVESGTLAVGSRPDACVVRGTMRNLTDSPRHAAATFVAVNQAGQEVGEAIEGVDLEPRQRKSYEANFLAPKRDVIKDISCGAIASFALTRLETCAPGAVPPFSSLCP